jgi:hypothetical protein
MDISKYLPIGEQDAIQVTILSGGNSLTGWAWRESNTSTEAMVRVTGGTLGAPGTKWAVADAAISAMSVPEAPPEAERSQP